MRGAGTPCASSMQGGEHFREPLKIRGSCQVQGGPCIGLIGIQSRDLDLHGPRDFPKHPACLQSYFSAQLPMLEEGLLDL